MRCRHAVAAVVVLLLGTSLLGPSAYAAHAGGVGGERMQRSTSMRAAPPGPPVQDLWPWPTICTEAAFTDYSVQPWGEGTEILLSGWIRPCPGVENPGVGRSFTLYYGDWAEVSEYLWPILDPYSQSYTFQVGGRRPSPPTAICVIDALYGMGPDFASASRRACIGIDHDDAGFVVAPIPTDDPRVEPLIRLPDTELPQPFCGSCL